MKLLTIENIVYGNILCCAIDNHGNLPFELLRSLFFVERKTTAFLSVISLFVNYKVANFGSLVNKKF